MTALSKRCEELKDSVEELSQELEVQYEKAQREKASSMASSTRCDDLQHEFSKLRQRFELQVPRFSE